MTFFEIHESFSCSFACWDKRRKMFLRTVTCHGRRGAEWLGANCRQKRCYSAAVLKSPYEDVKIPYQTLPQFMWSRLSQWEDLPAVVISLAVHQRGFGDLCTFKHTLSLSRCLQNHKKNNYTCTWSSERSYERNLQKMELQLNKINWNLNKYWKKSHFLYQKLIVHCLKKNPKKSRFFLLSFIWTFRTSGTSIILRILAIVRV